MEQDNYVDEYNDAESGILPDHGQNGVAVGYPVGGYPMAGYPMGYPYPAGYPYPQAPNGGMPPYMASPTTEKPTKATKKPPGWADENDKNETLNPRGKSKS